MLSFLAAHESHPPLFYILMRGWISIFGDSDTAARFLSLLIGVSIVPAVYAVGARLLSSPVALFAAFLTAIAPSLTEHGSQLRPYGLLPLTALASCCFMVLSIDDARLRNRIYYVVATLCMVYTHHWAWLVVAGQHVAWLTVALTRRRGDMNALLKRWGLIWIAVGIGYLPWVAALLHQASSAGHGGIAVGSIADAATVVLYGAFTFFSTVLPSRFHSPRVAAMVYVAAAVVGVLYVQRRDKHEGEDIHSDVAVPVFTIVCVTAMVAAVALSPFSDMLWPRCIVTLLPLLALVFSEWGRRAWRRNERGGIAAVAAALCCIVVANSAFEHYVLVTTPRSNSREAAGFIDANRNSSDLLVVAPDWYRPSLVRYLKSTGELVEFPPSTTEGLVDFSNVWERTSNPVNLERVLHAIERARSSNRRVWLVTSRSYLGDPSAAQLAEARERHQPKPVTVQAVSTIRSLLTTSFGSPDSAFRAHAREPLYDVLVVYRYDPLGGRR